MSSLLFKIVVSILIAGLIIQLYRIIDIQKIMFNYVIKQKQKVNFKQLTQCYLMFFGLNDQYQIIYQLKKEYKLILNNNSVQKDEQKIKEVKTKINKLSFIQGYYRLLIFQIYKQIKGYCTKGYYKFNQIYPKQILDQYYYTGSFYGQYYNKFKQYSKQFDDKLK